MSVEQQPGTKNKGPSRGDGLVVEIDGKKKVHKPMVTLSIDGPEMKHAAQIVEEVFPGTKEKAAANVQQQHEEQRQGEDVMYPNGQRMRLAPDHAENAINFMRRKVRSGPPATRPTFTMPGYFKTMPDGRKQLVRPGDPDY